MLEIVRPNFGSNSEGKKKKINNHYNESDMVEDLELDPDYEMFMSSLKPGYDDNVIWESSSLEYISRSARRKEESFKNMERKRTFKSDPERVPETSGGFLSKEKTRMPKTVKKSSKIRVKGSENKVRNVPIEDDKEVCVEPLKKMNSGKDVECCSYKSDETCIQRKDDEGGSDLEILTMDNLPFHEGQCTPFVSSKRYELLVDGDSWDGNRTCTRSQFREKLMDLLEIPYDQNEYESLWKKVTYKGPVQRLRELRGGISKQYSTNTEGNSYLDWYLDLKGKVDQFNHDRHKILYLLRGFFFWLQNTAHEGTGAFKPWLDSSYLNAIALG